MIMFLRFMRSQKNLVSRYVQYLWKPVTVCFFALKKVKYSRENRIQVHYSLAQPQPQLMLQFVFFPGVFHFPSPYHYLNTSEEISAARSFFSNIAKRTPKSQIHQFLAPNHGNRQNQAPKIADLKQHRKKWYLEEVDITQQNTPSHR